ncbi:phosphopantothenoylcysteine decarboxylase subunit VHS3-like [Pomacea canaliculata]|uniref:phosphopantothenoylcysteine decarboxylase subunit VHS3-like n=1 Tax=Pomacea canaliculata TaxID=400727 RepID=UPI000D7344EE|nr:phosphopantothenoylcysteine decarboxylase subunit VHS3-like [Pomacea canaliculata]
MKVCILFVVVCIALVTAKSIPDMVAAKRSEISRREALPAAKPDLHDQKRRGVDDDDYGPKDDPFDDPDDDPDDDTDGNPEEYFDNDLDEDFDDDLDEDLDKDPDEDPDDDLDENPDDLLHAKKRCDAVAGVWVCV